MRLATASPLVEGLARGQPESYAALYDRLGRSLLRVARVMLQASGEAEDAVQDVFVDLVRHRHRLAQVRDLDAYVFAMLRYAVGRRLQRQRLEQHHLHRLTPVGADTRDPCLPDELEEALKSLPPEQREVITLKVDGGLTFAQIAEILKVNANTAASRYRYALEKLRRVLE
ncbi:MAG: sigma-70 family RNA polymerase sigma factor [Tepidisphaeraceae bacterium]|jgi:RNA polymerase sigma-70 factor (ECF subfamily)